MADEALILAVTRAQQGDARVHDDRNIVLLFAERAEFAAVQEDAEFRQAIGR